MPRKIFGLWKENVRFKQFARFRGRVSKALPWRSEALAPVALGMAGNSFKMKNVPLMLWEHPVKKKDFTLKV